VLVGLVLVGLVLVGLVLVGLVLVLVMNCELSIGLVALLLLGTVSLFK
jgi:hypothetical protein